MAFPIDSGLRIPAAWPAAPTEAGGKPGGQFRRLIENAVNHVEDLRGQADGSVRALLAGEGKELHQTALDVQRADLAFELFLETRNKVVQAYQEVMRMQM